jgi:hypothetical protein
LLLVRPRSLREVMLLRPVQRLLRLPLLLVVLQAMSQRPRDLLLVMLKEHMMLRPQKWVLQRQQLQL